MAALESGDPVALLILVESCDGSLHQPILIAQIGVGHMRLTLVCSSDAPDFDLWAQVMMVLPDGSAVQLGQPDIRRARFRNGFFRQQLLKAGEIVEIPFEFSWIAWRIPGGARLRLVLMPLNSPSFQKNSNRPAPDGVGKPGIRDKAFARGGRWDLHWTGGRAVACTRARLFGFTGWLDCGQHCDAQLVDR
jgi:predicted acyl esterase